MVKRYEVLSNDEYDAFQRIVNDFVRNGAELIGGVHVVKITGNYPNTIYFQAVLVEAEVDEL